MNTLDYILSCCQQSNYSRERAVLRALVHTLEPEELNKLQKSKCIDTGVYCVVTKFLEDLDGNVQQKNETISSLLKQLADKKSGKVMSSRKKLQDRFEKQDFQTQRKILKAFLSSSKKDRLWAYAWLRKNWDNMLYEKVKSLWELYHERECGQVVLKYFPVEYVYNNREELDTDDNYTWLCIRLINYPQFQIDKERLCLIGKNKLRPNPFRERNFYRCIGEVEYLYILAKSKSKIKKGEATRILYKQIVANLYDDKISCKLKELFYDVLQNNYYKIYSENYYPTTKWFDNVSIIFWCMGRLGLAEELIAYEEWDNMVQHRLVDSADYKELLKYHIDDFCEGCYTLFRNTIIECLPNEYKCLIYDEDKYIQSVLS